MTKNDIPNPTVFHSNFMCFLSFSDYDLKISVFQLLKEGWNKVNENGGPPILILTSET